MIKVISLVKRKPGMSLEDFSKYWEEKHAPIVLRNTQIKKYVQCHAVNLPSGEQPYDGAAELCFDDMNSYKAWMEAFQSRDAKAIKASQEEAANFLDPSQVVTIITEEKVLR